MKTKLIVALWGILSLTAAGLTLSACGSDTAAVVTAPEPSDPEPQPQNEPEEEPAVQPEVHVDCVAEGFCETGHECSLNAECGSKKCELTVGLCIDSCGAGFTFWTANGSPAGTCIPTPHPHPAEGWM